MAATPTQLTIQDLGSMAYHKALAIQRSRQQEVIAGRDGPVSHPGFLLMVEHEPPVITVSRRAEAGSHLIATPDMLRNAGVDVCETDRGGDITYHGPGQLVVYPILDLNRLGLRLHGYMRWLEDRVLDVLAEFGITGHQDGEATGVWVNSEGEARKVCALGVRVSRWVSMHGLALNVDPDLSHFDLIVPCGLHGRGVTSMRRELKDACPPMADVRKAMERSFQRAVSEPR